jgi:hypothetical protein
MAIDERARHQLFLRLEEHLGPEAATTLMEHLPPTGWADVATKRDLDQLRAATKSDIHQLRAATKSDIHQLRAATKSDIDQLRAATKSDIDQLRAATKSDIDQLRAATKSDIGHHAELTRIEIGRFGDELRAELHKALAEQTRTVVLTAAIANVGAVLAVGGLAFAAARLG